MLRKGIEHKHIGSRLPCMFWAELKFNIVQASSVFFHCFLFFRIKSKHKSKISISFKAYIYIYMIHGSFLFSVSMPFTLLSLLFGLFKVNPFLICSFFILCHKSQEQWTIISSLPFWDEKLVVSWITIPKCHHVFYPRQKCSSHMYVCA